MGNLEKASILSCEKWCNSFLEYDEFPFSKHFEKVMYKLIDKMRNDRYHKFTRNTIKILIIAAILLSLAFTAFAFQGTRKYIIKHFQNYFSYAITEDVEAEKAEEISANYVPEDFVLTEEYNEGLRTYKKYEKGDLWISIFEMPIDAEINYNDANQEIVECNNIEYITYDNENSTGVIWNNGTYVYRMDGNLSKDELLKIAFEVK